MRNLLILCIMIAGCMGCAKSVKSEKPTVTVSIAPLVYLVERLADTLVSVKILVPETTSPETYEPTVRQISELTKSELYFAVGLIDFEQSLRAKIESVAPNTQYVNLAEGVDVMNGVCSHGVEEHNHAHSIDPHIWLSPRLMSKMGERVALELIEKYPQSAQTVMTNLRALQEDIFLLDSTIKSNVKDNNIKNFGIVHPSLTYFARDYGLEQIEIELQGKEPSAGVVKTLVDKMRIADIKKILYSRQASSAAAQAVAAELGIEIVEYDPLRGDWLANIYYLNGLLCN